MNIDVVYFNILKTINNHTELRFSLRSLEKYVTDYNDVYIIGFLPDWCQNVIHILMNDPHTKNKDANIIRKMIHCCNNKQISDPFLFVNDDHFFSCKVKACEFLFYHKGLLISDTTNLLYKHRVNRTKELLMNAGKPIYNYDIHTPILIYKEKFLNAFEGVDYINNFLVMKSWYMNNWEGFDKGVEILDCKFTSSERRNLLELKQKVKKRPCFTVTDQFSKQVLNLLHCMYSEPSKYEQVQEC